MAARLTWRNHAALCFAPASEPVEMSFAQVWTVREAKQTRMDMYSDRDEALEALGRPE